MESVSVMMPVDILILTHKRQKKTQKLDNKHVPNANKDKSKKVT
jgi:hypothetical protein